MKKDKDWWLPLMEDARIEEDILSKRKNWEIEQKHQIVLFSQGLIKKQEYWK